MQIGTLHGTASPATITAEKFNRHTFWCGQSGSGKTYALGVVLEQLLLATGLPIVVLDPNSDFVHLDEVRGGVASPVAEELRSRSIRILRPSTLTPDDPLAVRFVDLPSRSRAAVLQLDPIGDIVEYNALLRASRDLVGELDAGVVEWLRSLGDEQLDRVAMRIENLGIADWSVWAWGRPGLTQVLDERADATVFDLGSFADHGEPGAAALAVLDHLWTHRHRRQPTLIVIDEAHNICPPDPVSPVARLLTERITQIAAEGRKYGLWLVLSTQRPSKVHPNVISQCDNLVLMKTGSPSDLAVLGDVFGHVPKSLLDQASGFAKGQALVAGGFTDEPQIVQIAERLTVEGGSDVEVPRR